MQFFKSKKKRWLLYTLLASATVFGSARLYYRLTDDFRLANIQEDLSYRSEWEVDPLSAEQKQQIQKILSQPFYYIGKGAQSYAFSSEDNQYVLKFFKFKHLRPTPILSWLPSWSPTESYRLRQASRKERKLEGVFSGYHLAYHVHREESGLIFIHLNKTQGLYNHVTLIDKIGRKHVIDLDSVVFLIQRKGETLRTVFNRLLDNGDLEGAKKKISQIFALYLSEYQKGIFDHDHGVMHNAGYIGDQPIHLDVGKLKNNPNMRSHEVYSADIALVANRMAQWFKENRPNEYASIASYIDNQISEITKKND